MSETGVGWLLAGDPSIRWQTERDLLDRPPEEWTRTRARVATEGWGEALLEAQDPSGTWAGGLYSPKWRSTTYTLLQLRRLGLDPANAGAIAGCRRLLEADWVDGGVSFWSGRLLAERCVNGMVLSTTAWFDGGDDRIDDIAQLLLRAQMADGGWNCRDHQGAVHSSFHTTISVLEGLTIWQRRRGTAAAEDAMAAGTEFMFAHNMCRSHRTGEVINPAWLKFSFPPRWHYDVLRGLDHLQDVGATTDPRAAEAIDVVRAAQRSDGGWPIGPRYSGERWFTMESGRLPGRWNTLRARRVLRWWDSAAS